MLTPEILHLEADFFFPMYLLQILHSLWMSVLQSFNSAASPLSGVSPLIFHHGSNEPPPLEVLK